MDHHRQGKTYQCLAHKTVIGESPPLKNNTKGVLVGPPSCHYAAVLEVSLREPHSGAVTYALRTNSYKISGL